MPLSILTQHTSGINLLIQLVHDGQRNFQEWIPSHVEEDSQRKYWSSNENKYKDVLVRCYHHVSRLPLDLQCLDCHVDFRRLVHETLVRQCREELELKARLTSHCSRRASMSWITQLNFCFEEWVSQAAYWICAYVFAPDQLVHCEDHTDQTRWTGAHET